MHNPENPNPQTNDQETAPEQHLREYKHSSEVSDFTDAEQVSKWMQEEIRDLLEENKYYVGPNTIQAILEGIIEHFGKELGKSVDVRNLEKDFDLDIGLDSAADISDPHNVKHTPLYIVSLLGSKIFSIDTDVDGYGGQIH